MIRPYREEDAVVLTEIWLAASLRAHDFVNDAFWRSRAAEVREIWLPAAKTLVWEENGRPAAFVSIIDNEYIGALFVEPSRQGRGIGSGLLSFVQNGRKSLKLRVYAKNKRAAAFYVRHGFREEQKGIDENTGEEELLMIWRNPKAAPGRKKKWNTRRKTVIFFSRWRTKKKT